MTRITINLSDEELKILEKRAEKNFLTTKEQIEDIVRRSTLRSKKGTSRMKVNDRLVHIFSREQRGRKRKKEG